MRRLLAFVVVMAAFTTACAQATPSDPVLEAYFDQVATAADRYNERLGEAEALSEAGIDQNATDDTFDAELVVALKRLFSDGVVITRDFVDDLAAVAPPGPVTTQHATSVDTGRRLVDALDDLDRSLATVDQLEVLQLAVAESVAAKLIVEFDRACIVLEAVAIENGITVQLNCGG